MEKPKILCFAGSARVASVNKKLAKSARAFIERSGGTAEYIDFSEYDLPIYNEDLLQKDGFPTAVLKLKTLFLAHDAFLISSPEYNSSISPLLKNVIDWVSVSLPEEPPLSLVCYKNKVAGLLSASPGGLGGLRGLFHLREILMNIGVTVVPEMFALSHAYSAFDEADNLKDASNQDRLERVVGDLLKLTQQVAANVAH